MIVSILFSKPLNFNIASYGIMFVEKSPFSHSCFLYEDTRTGQMMVYEASHGRVHEISFDEWKKKNLIVRSVVLDIDEKKFNLMVFLFNKYKQVKYAFIQIIGVLLFYIFNVKRNIFHDGDDTFFCSELCSFILVTIGVLKTNIPLELIGPKKLYELLT